MVLTTASYYIFVNVIVFEKPIRGKILKYQSIRIKFCIPRIKIKIVGIEI